MVYYDIKFENIFIDFDGNVVFFDFGVVYIFDEFYVFVLFICGMIVYVEFELVV